MSFACGGRDDLAALVSSDFYVPFYWKNDYKFRIGNMTFKVVPDVSDGRSELWSITEDVHASLNHGKELARVRVMLSATPEFTGYFLKDSDGYCWLQIGTLHYPDSKSTSFVFKSTIKPAPPTVIVKQEDDVEIESEIPKPGEFDVAINVVRALVKRQNNRIIELETEVMKLRECGLNRADKLAAIQRIIDNK